jgi:hypothetical protein
MALHDTMQIIEKFRENFVDKKDKACIERLQ